MKLLTLLFPLLALGGMVAGGVIQSRDGDILTLDNGLDRGVWGPVDYCHSCSYAFGFEIKYSGTGFLDDTSVNAIRLFCQNSQGMLTDIISSIEGSYGQWRGMRSCPQGENLIGLRANVVPDMGAIGDDLGMDNLEMNCTNGKILDGLNGTPPGTGQGPLMARTHSDVESEMEVVHLKIPRSARSRDFGDWGSWASCSPGNSVCGLSVRLEDNHVLDDDAGVTDVIMHCCKWECLPL